MNTIVNSTKGWAIFIGSADVAGLLGKYYWFHGYPNIVPDCLAGYKTAVFATRREARAVLDRVRRSYPKAKVVRVRVDISIEGGS